MASTALSSDPGAGLALFPGTAGAAVGTPTTLNAVQRTLWKQVDSLWGGTRTMRLAAEAYLPRQAAETDPNYKKRLARSTLNNVYRSAIQSAVGKVFSQDVVVEKPSIEIQLVAQDVDAQGRNLSQFAKSVMEDAINHGVAYILVDHTRVPEEYTNLADQQASGARPYWVGISATKVLEARSADFGGSMRLGYFRFEEEVYEPSDDGFSGSTFRQVRIFRQDPGTPVNFAVYRETRGELWRLIDSGVLQGVDSIPVVPVYTNRFSFFMGSPPLQDLADVNVQHWQCDSDYQNSVHTATIPFLLTKGLQAQMDADGNLTELKVDVNAGVVATDPQATVEWIEVSGAALSAARANLDALMQTMERLGATLCSRPSGGITATEKSVNAAEANSIVKGWALGLQDALVGAVYFTAQYLGTSEPGDVKVNTDYAIDYASEATMSNVVDLYKNGAITAETAIAEGQRRNILDPHTEIQAGDGLPTAPTNTDATAMSEALTTDPAIKAAPAGTP